MNRPVGDSPGVALDGGLPPWLPRIALADEIGPEMLTLAALSVGENPPPGEWRDVFERLHNSGLLESVSATGPAALTPPARDALLDRLRNEPGLHRARAELLATGIANEMTALAGQLALWARQSGDWASLQSLWLRFPVGEFARAPQSTQAFTAIPSEQRREHPALSYAAAFIAALHPDEDRFDLDQFIGDLIADGRTLHAQWARHDSADAGVMAGTMRLLAQSSLVYSVEDQQLEQAYETYQGLKRFIAEHNGKGASLSPLPLAFFHTTSASLMILRAEWLPAKHHADLALVVGQQCNLLGLLASTALAVTMTMMGSQSGYEHAERLWHKHAAARPILAAAVEPQMVLPRLVVAVRTLDAEAAQHDIERLAPGTAVSRWFNYWPIEVWVRTNAAMLWRPPEQALAEFDSSTSGMVVAGSQHYGIWNPLLLRARAELLINIGALNNAKQIIDELGHANRAFSLATAARLQLAGGDYKAAVTLADEGIHSSQVAVYERAHLQTIKAAAMELSGYDVEAVDRQVMAACLISRESGTLVPWAMIPSETRTVLLSRHGAHPDGSPCVLAGPIAAGTFDVFQRNYGRQTLITLSPREQALLPLLVSPLTLQQIADQSYVSINTVRKQVVTLRKKLGAASRAELSERARELGLLHNLPPQ